MPSAQLRFPVADRAPSSSIVEALAGFDAMGARTVVERRGDVPFLFNEFWTARQRQAHSIHEVSYRACFKPQLPEFFIGRLTAPGDVVYDPFMGRGTTPIQAALMGRAALGADINPLSVCLARPRTRAPALEEIATRLAEIDWSGEAGADEELLAFYHPETLRQIAVLRRYLLARDAAGALDAVDDWIRMVAVNRLTGHSSGFFSVYSLPPNQAVSAQAQRKINARRGQTPPLRDVPALILRKSRSLLADGRPPPAPDARFLVGSADASPEIATASVSLVVTSPPFLDVVHYAADNWLRSWFCGVEAAGVDIAMHSRPANWTAFIARVFAELERVVAPGGHVAFEVGEVRGGKVRLEEQVLQALSGLAFEPLCVVVNVQAFTKTANCWGVSNNAKGTNTNRIILARRGARP